jgi:hypothetical protein
MDGYVIKNLPFRSVSRLETLGGSFVPLLLCALRLGLKSQPQREDRERNDKDEDQAGH